MHDTFDLLRYALILASTAVWVAIIVLALFEHSECQDDEWRP
jgi:hypothetical protein